MIHLFDACAIVVARILAVLDYVRLNRPVIHAPGYIAVEGPDRKWIAERIK